MSQERVYLDYNATAPLRPAARIAMLQALDRGGNPSSVHAEGRAARALVEEARITVAQWLGTDPKAVTFTSGGTEALNLALTPSLTDGGAPLTDLLVGAAEHPCVLEGHRFPADRVRTIPLTSDGIVDVVALEALLDRTAGRALVAAQVANNETGAIQPIATVADLVHSRGGLLVCDAVQSAGRLPSDFAPLNADVLAVSAHKIGGPKGVGALAFRGSSLHIGQALVRGGGQERGARSGTENVAGIAGFSAAIREAEADREAEQARLRQLRDRLESDLGAGLPELVFFARGAPRLANTSCFAVPGVSAETLLIALDLGGLAVSSGSACSSGKVKASHVLAAMGVPAGIARGALRVSLGWASDSKDVDRFCETMQKTVRNMLRRRAVPAAQ